jgi:hypothetical protein
MTLKFKWFPQYEVCSLAEAISKKFTIKDKIQNIVERKSLKTQNPNIPKFHYNTIEIILKRRI